MKCPIDDTELLITHRNDIEIDYCPRCRGVWLDRGELDKIIERSGTSVQTVRPAPERRVERYDDDDDDDYRYDKPKRKRKSFLDDLFDF